VKRGLVLVLASGVAAGAAFAATRPVATVRLVDTSPLVIRGQHFRSGERVTVTIVAGTKFIRHRRASATGIWRVGLPNVTIGRCEALSVIAIGRRGSRAALKHLPLPQCLPA
jgi:hypothetical protein